MVQKAEKFIGVCGTEYHRSIDDNPERDIIEELKGKYLGAIANVEVNGVMFNIQHGASGAYIYRAMLMDREGLFNLAAAECKKIPHADVILQGHLHYYAVYDYEQQMMIRCPCWQAYIP